MSSLSLFSQKELLFNIDEQGKESYTEVVESKLSKDNLFSNAQEWVAKTFGDYKSVIQFENKDDGKLILKGFSSIDYVAKTSISSTTEKLKYIITIECKDLKYRFIISDIEIERSHHIFGSPTIDLKTRSYHLELIDGYGNDLKKHKAKIDSLESINMESLKKKDVKKTNQLLIDTIEREKWTKQWYDDENILLRKEHDAIVSLSESLKKAMSKDNSF